jgi:hypothetical protein
MRISKRREWLVTIAQHWNSDDCLLWPFKGDKDGYGRVDDFDGVETRAHRLIFKIVHGRWPNPCAMHSCDTPACCNLRHISEGTTAQNQRDKALRGRSIHGADQHDAKLTDDKVREIKLRYKPRVYGYGAHCLAQEYGVSKRIVQLIVRGKIWRHVV